MAEKERIFVAPNAFLYYDKKNYTIEVELPGPDKKDIKVEAGENGFCVTAPRDDIKYSAAGYLPTRPFLQKQWRRSRMDF